MVMTQVVLTVLELQLAILNLITVEYAYPPVIIRVFKDVMGSTIMMEINLLKINVVSVVVVIYQIVGFVIVLEIQMVVRIMIIVELV
jgi:hypothetical protein